MQIDYPYYKFCTSLEIVNLIDNLYLDPLRDIEIIHYLNVRKLLVAKRKASLVGLKKKKHK